MAGQEASYDHYLYAYYYHNNPYNNLQNGWPDCEDCIEITRFEVTNKGWQTYEFSFTPTTDYNYLMIASFGGTGFQAAGYNESYKNGSILIDNIRLRNAERSCLPLVGGGEVCGSEGTCDDNIDLSYNKHEAGEELNIWNADDKFDFTTFYTLNPDLQAVINQDPDRVEWYIRDNIQHKYRKVDDPKNFYFGALGPDRDEWGLVVLYPFYKNDEGGLCAMDSTLIEVVDRGMYFRNAAGQIQRWHEAVYNSQPDLYTGFFDSSKPTLFFSHGWQPGANIKHLGASSLFNPSTPETRDQRKRLIEDDNGEDLASYWLSRNWNVCLYFWTQFAEFNSEGTTLNAFPRNTARNIYRSPTLQWLYGTPAWLRLEGTMSTRGAPLINGLPLEHRPVGDDFAERIVSIRTLTGSTTDMRWVGHSLGAIVLTSAITYMKREGIVGHEPSRMAYLD
ncbi:MAG: hypothetical protein AAF734_10935, partial [Bacteroidota bacterium]